MRKWVALLGVLSLLVLTAGISQAAEKAGKKAKGPKEPDLGAIFDKMDVNHNGRVSRQEFIEFFQKMWQERADKLFEQADTNHDGVLTLEEAKKEADRLGERFRSGENRPDVEAIFNQMDTNHNGKVSKEEFHRFMRQHTEKEAGQVFDKADTNHNGSLDRQEFMKAAEQFRERMQERARPKKETDQR